MIKILLVEDDETIAKGLCYLFQQNHYDIIHKNTIDSAKNYLNETKPACMILDVTLPDGNGFTFYKEIIKEMHIPTIFLTAKDEEDDIVKGFDLGAEDYITKPFLTRELLARVNRIVRNMKEKNLITIKDITFDFDKMIVYKHKEKLVFTSLELKILHLLFMNINKVVSRTFIIQKIWEWTGNDVYDNTVTVYLKRIRQKLGTDIIKTIKGIGYRIDEE